MPLVTRCQRKQYHRHFGANMSNRLGWRRGRGGAVSPRPQPQMGLAERPRTKPIPPRLHMLRPGTTAYRFPQPGAVSIATSCGAPLGPTASEPGSDARGAGTIPASARPVGHEAPAPPTGTEGRLYRVTMPSTRRASHPTATSHLNWRARACRAGRALGRRSIQRWGRHVMRAVRGSCAYPLRPCSAPFVGHHHHTVCPRMVSRRGRGTRAGDPLAPEEFQVEVRRRVDRVDDRGMAVDAA